MISSMAHVFYKTHAKKKHFIDKVIYLIALIAPLMTIPQMMDVWFGRKVDGVSLATWSAYAGVSALWIIYGLYHKEKPVILTNLLLFLFDTAIVIGVVLYR